MLYFKKGDLITMADHGDFDVIVHGCNCFNTMGAGIAKQIKNRYPGAWRVDQDTDCGDITKLGNWTQYETRHLTIINAYTQFKTRTENNQDVFEYASFDVILRKLTHLYADSRFGLPYIGMGLAGGDKDRIMSMIQSFAQNVDSVTLVEYDG